LTHPSSCESVRRVGMHDPVAERGSTMKKIVVLAVCVAALAVTSVASALTVCPGTSSGQASPTPQQAAAASAATASVLQQLGIWR
jgi:hypothetical protein